MAPSRRAECALATSRTVRESLPAVWEEGDRQAGAPSPRPSNGIMNCDWARRVMTTSTVNAQRHRPVPGGCWQPCKRILDLTTGNAAESASSIRVRATLGNQHKLNPHHEVEPCRSGMLPGQHHARPPAGRGRVWRRFAFSGWPLVNPGEPVSARCSGRCSAATIRTTS